MVAGGGLYASMGDKYVSDLEFQLETTEIIGTHTS